MNRTFALAGVAAVLCACSSDPGLVVPPSAPLPQEPAVQRAQHSQASADFDPVRATGQGECADGIDNDQDGLVDWVYDTGCYGETDGSEAARPRAQEDGFTTFEIGPDSRAVYVSSQGSDERLGQTPKMAVRTLARAAELVRDGYHDFILLRRGDTWRDEQLGRFKSGRDGAHPLVIASYGASKERPVILVRDDFLDHAGKPRSFVALLDLHLEIYTQDPKDPAFTGKSSNLVSYIGGGAHLLIEGCRLHYGELVIGSPAFPVYESVEIRRNTIDHVYHVGTCKAGDPNGDPAYRPSGMYSSHVDHLLVEENTFDHNGWSEEVEAACATIYNHNIYLNAHHLVIRGNIFLRPSSVHAKLRSDVPDGMTDILVEDNFFAEGEVGVSIGGNTFEKRRFVNSIIRRNVFYGIGSTRPTGRNLAWGIWVQGVDGLVVSDNMFLRQDAPGVENSYGIELSHSARNVDIAHNLFFRVQTASVSVKRKGEREKITVRDNLFINDGVRGAVVSHMDGFENYQYSGNRYVGGHGDKLFSTPRGPAHFEGWVRQSGEANGRMIPMPTLKDTSRDLSSYAQTLGVGPTLGDYAAALSSMGRLNWRPQLLAPALNAYIQDGFDFVPGR